MLKIENADIVGWEAAVRGMRNPMNSWAKGDSGYSYVTDVHAIINGELTHQNPEELIFCVGKNDWDLMTRLRNSGTDHRKFMRMITVYVDIVGPLYWWKEFDTYKVGTVANSCSTMHKIHDKEFTMEDFSHEHLIGSPIPNFKKSCHVTEKTMDGNAAYSFGLKATPHDFMYWTIEVLNAYRALYLETKDKKYWWQMIQLLPSSYNQRRTVMLNYEVLANIYKSRRHHKLNEWHTLCDWIESLPYSELIVGGECNYIKKGIY